jgi:hypothetical protein
MPISLQLHAGASATPRQVWSATVHWIRTKISHEKKINLRPLRAAVKPTTTALLMVDVRWSDHEFLDKNRGKYFVAAFELFAERYE